LEGAEVPRPRLREDQNSSQFNEKKVRTDTSVKLGEGKVKGKLKKNLSWG